MRKFYSVEQLFDGVKVVAQFSNRDNKTGTAPEWSEPKVVTLYVQMCKGKPVTITPTDFSWAEYGPRDYDSNYNEFLCEEYRMRILEVK